MSAVMSLTARPTPAFNSCRQQKLSLDVRQPHALAYRSFVPRYQRGSLHIACTAKPKATERRLVRKVCLPVEAYVCTASADFGCSELQWLSSPFRLRQAIPRLFSSPCYDPLCWVWEQELCLSSHTSLGRFEVLHRFPRFQCYRVCAFAFVPS